MAEKLITVEVVKDYKDIEKGLLYHPREQHEVTKSRADKLVGLGLVRVIESKVTKEQK